MHPKFHLNQAHLLAQVLPALPRADQRECVREILRRLKLGLEAGGSTA